MRYDINVEDVEYNRHGGTPHLAHKTESLVPRKPTCDLICEYGEVHGHIEDPQVL